MKTVLALGFLTMSGFVAYQQWSYQKPSDTVAASLNWFQSEKKAVAPAQDVVIHGRTFSVAVLQGMYEKIKGAYVMHNGECLHLWQNPAAAKISYEDFVRQVKQGYYFPELSEKGAGDQVVLEHQGMKKGCRDNTASSSTRVKCCN